MSFIVVRWKPSRAKQRLAASTICRRRAAACSSLTLGIDSRLAAHYKERSFFFLVRRRRMVRIDSQIDIDRPIGEVFAYVTDPAKLAEWQETTVSVTKETAGPMGAGTRLREVRRAPLGKRVESRVEVSEYERDRVFATRILDGPLKIDGGWRFEGDDGHTRLRFAAQGDLHGPLRLVEPLVTRVLRRQFGIYHRRLKENLES
jgi:ligand-binding SRPBCC domain-containing protein